MSKGISLSFETIVISIIILIVLIVIVLFVTSQHNNLFQNLFGITNATTSLANEVQNLKP